jgi:hypothetical protein
LEKGKAAVLTTDGMMQRNHDYADLYRLLKSDQHYRDNFMDCQNKALEKLMYESMLIIQGLDCLDQLHPATVWKGWMSPMNTWLCVTILAN